MSQEQVYYYEFTAQSLNRLITEATDWHDRSIKFVLKEIGYLVVITSFFSFVQARYKPACVVVMQQLYYIIYIIRIVQIISHSQLGLFIVVESICSNYACVIYIVVVFGWSLRS